MVADAICSLQIHNHLSIALGSMLDCITIQPHPLPEDATQSGMGIYS
jgi:hypothetical protein